MPYIPLQIPPGVYRNGTKYQAKGRWYDANLVRWHEGIMQPVGGWGKISRSDSPDIEAAIADDGGAFTDETTDANDADVGDVQLLPVAPASDDAFYVGMSYPFAGISIAISTVATDGAVTWEYYDGSAWQALTATDNTTSFKTTGTNTVVWPIPGDWATTTINSQGPFFYVRARVTTQGTSQALATTIDLTTAPLRLGEVIRGMRSWRDNSQNAHLAMGTPTKLYTFSSGTLTDATPSALTTGSADASYTAGNFGAGGYGSGFYGTGDSSQGTIVEAQTWQIDTFGEDIVACAYSDGRIVYWDKSAGGAATAVTDATAADPPLLNGGVVVTPERFVVALGADADGRYIRWSDQEDANDWTASASNQAGDFTLPGSGEIMCGERNRNETLIWTTVDLFAMRYIGGAFVYTFQQVGANCGIISRHAKATVDGRAYWMGHRGFFMYDGAAHPIPCDVNDDIFNDLNPIQKSKITAWPVSDFREIWFAYPSASSDEIDSVVVYNYAENHWSGPWALERLGGVDRGSFGYPVAADSNGCIYYHETGTSYLKPDDVTSLTPSVESGPIEIANGDRVMTIRRLIPDEGTLGDVTGTLYASLYPTATEDSQAITLAAPTSCRLTGRQVRLKLTQSQPEWRVGIMRLEVTPRGLR